MRIIFFIGTVDLLLSSIGYLIVKIYPVGAAPGLRWPICSLH